MTNVSLALLMYKVAVSRYSV